MGYTATKRSKQGNKINTKTPERLLINKYVSQPGMKAEHLCLNQNKYLQKKMNCATQTVEGRTIKEFGAGGVYGGVVFS